MALVSTLAVDWTAVLAKAGDLGNPQVSLAKRVALALASGVVANAADVVFADTRTIAPSATDSLDVATGGGLLDALGTAIAMVKLKGLLVVAAGANVNNVNVTRPANGVPFFLASGDGIPVLPGGYFAWAAPNLAAIAVTAATADLIDIINSGGTTSVTYDVVIVGASA